MEDIDKIVELVTAFATAPTWKAVAILFAGFVLSMLYIAKFFWNENRRREDEYRHYMKVRQLEADRIALMQKDVSKAVIDGMDTAYEQDYEYYAKMIEEKNYSAVYLKNAQKFHDKISEVLYQESLSAHERSALVIAIVRGE